MNIHLTTRPSTVILIIALFVACQSANAAIIQIDYTGFVDRAESQLIDTRPDGATRPPPDLFVPDFSIGETIHGQFRINLGLDGFSNDFVVSSIPNPLRFSNSTDRVRVNGFGGIDVIDGTAPANSVAIDSGWKVPTNRAFDTTGPFMQTWISFDLGIPNVDGIESLVGQSFTGVDFGRGSAAFNLALVDLSIGTPGYPFCPTDCDLFMTRSVGFDLRSINVTRVPEPGTLSVVALGLLGMGLAKRCRRYLHDPD